MSFKSITLLSIILLAGCASDESQQSGNLIRSTNLENNPITPVNTIQSTGNSCADNFNFLKLSNYSNYQSLSERYIEINNGYKFLKENREIMGEDARRIYTMNLDMKLDTICSEVESISFQLIQDKIKSLNNF